MMTKPIYLIKPAYKLLNIRKKLIAWLFTHAKNVYASAFKTNKPWKIQKNDLLQLPNESFGRHIGHFLETHNFDLILKAERHDAYHVLTGYGAKVEDEIALQYFLFGNGKKGLSLYAVIIFGIIALPDYLNYYINSFYCGKQANAFYNYPFKDLLRYPINDLKAIIFTNTQLSNLNQLQNEYKTIY